MERKVQLSIIIISYNTCKLTLRCLQTIFDSLFNALIKYEVLVIDNGSIDRTNEVINKEFPQVKLIQNNTNIGYGRANNQGIKAAEGDVILLLNSDIEVIDNAIEKLYQFFLSLPPDCIVGGKLFNIDKTVQPSAGPVYSLPMIFTALFLKGDYNNLTRYSPNSVREVDWVMGACMMFRKATFGAIGGFDLGIFMYMDEIDWQYRAQKRGCKIYFYPDAHFVHVGAGSSQGRKFPILNVYRGLIYYYNKHYNVVYKIILRAILLLKAIIAILLFTLLNRKSDRKIYFEALKITIK